MAPGTCVLIILESCIEGVNRQSNLKLNLKQLKLQGRICLASGRICLSYAGYVRFGGRICPVTRNFMQQKSRLGAKTMRLGPDKLTVSKLDNTELREITGTTRSNLNSSIQI
jgi:hypothetical protein